MAVTNTGIVERNITGVNESDLWLDTEATSSVSNTGVVERSITGVNDGGDLFLDNSTSTATNTGIVERGVTGVNESDLWLDAESTSVVNNTGIVERPITGVHDANFVKPLGDELIVNSGFDADTAWTKGTGWSIGDGVAIRDNTAGNSYIGQSVSLVGGKTYEFNFKVNSITGTGSVYTPSTAETIATYTTIGDKKIYFTPSNTQIYILGWYGISGAELEIDNVSVKEVLVTRDSSVVNIAEVIIPLLDSLEARATTFENREATQEILINLQKC